MFIFFKFTSEQHNTGNMVVCKAWFISLMWSKDNRQTLPNWKWSMNRHKCPMNEWMNEWRSKRWVLTSPCTMIIIIWHPLYFSTSTILRLECCVLLKRQGCLGSHLVPYNSVSCDKILCRLQPHNLTEHAWLIHFFQAPFTSEIINPNSTMCPFRWQVSCK